MSAGDESPVGSRINSLNCALYQLNAKFLFYCIQSSTSQNLECKRTAIDELMSHYHQIHSNLSDQSIHSTSQINTAVTGNLRKCKPLCLTRVAWVWHFMVEVPPPTRAIPEKDVWETYQRGFICKKGEQPMQCSAKTPCSQVCRIFCLKNVT